MADEDTTEMVGTTHRKNKGPASNKVKPTLPPFRPMRTTGAPASVDAQASATGTTAVVLAGMKAAYKWTKKTKLTRAEFLQKRAAWLSSPASEV